MILVEHGCSDMNLSIRNEADFSLTLKTITMQHKNDRINSNVKLLSRSGPDLPCSKINRFKDYGTRDGSPKFYYYRILYPLTLYNSILFFDYRYYMANRWFILCRNIYLI